MAAMLGACAHAPSKSIADDQARFEGTVLAGNVAAIDAQRDIVLAVANQIIAPASHAGSNILGYGSPAQYRNGQRAMSTLADLEQPHGLRETVRSEERRLGTAWVSTRKTRWPPLP